MSSFLTKLVSLTEISRRLDLKRQAFAKLFRSWIGIQGFSSAGLSATQRVSRNFSSRFEWLEARAMMALLNELKVNPPGSATGANKYQYIELAGSVGEALNNQYVVMLDGNGAGAGSANYVANLSSRVLGSNGLLMIKSPTGGHSAGSGATVVTDTQFDNASGILSKNTVSFFLVSSTAPVIQGTDYDTNNDGTLDNLPVGFTILDSVGWSDGDVGDKVYGSVTLTQTQGTPDAASRIVGTTNTATSAWFNGDLYAVGSDATQLLFDYTRASSNLPIDPFIASLTPGVTNFVQSTTTKALRMVNYNVTGSSGAGLPRTGMNTLLQAFGSEVVGTIARPLDLISMQEVLSQTTTGASIAGMLNTLYGAGVYATSTLNGGSTGSGTQGFVYKTSTLTLLSETAIGTPSTTAQPRQTIRAKFRPAGTTGTSDFYVYNGHWKSADTTADEARRLVEAQAIRADADALGQGANIFVVGDFNIYRNTDNAFEAITAAGNAQVFDPLNRIGNWHDNASFTDVLTQAPAIAPPGGLTGGGLDDRFDWQMFSGELLDSQGLDYRSGSYHTFGNNGSVPLNGNINDAASTALPGLTNRTTVLDLLTTVSDHLPVVADFTYSLQPPTDLGLSISTIAENAGANATVGTLSSVDLDAGDTFTYTLVAGTGSTDNTSFNINGSTLRATASFNFEAKSSYTVRVRTTDASGLFFEKAFTITVTNVNEAPTDIALSAISIPENAGANAVVGTLSTTDADVGNTFVYSLVAGTGSTDNLAFNVTGSTLTANSSFNFETKSSYSIRVRTTDQGGLFFEKIFTINVTDVNEPVVLTRANASVAGNVLTQLTNTGTWSDPESGTVTLSASFGTVTKNVESTWSWSHIPSVALLNQVVTISASDGTNVSNVTFSVTAYTTIATRGIQYVGATGASALTSLATDKAPLLPGQSSTFANYTNYSRGLNGLVIDVVGLPATVTNTQLAASFQFANWDGIAAAGFVALPGEAVPTVATRAGGVAGSTRVAVTFPDNTVQNTWLRVTVLANSDTGLAINDVFYFGNVIGDFNVDNTPSRIRVNEMDTAAVRNNQAFGTNAVDVSNIYDVNRDGRVNPLDTSIVRNNQQSAGTVAPIIAPSSSSRAARGSSGASVSKSNAVPSPLAEVPSKSNDDSDGSESQNLASATSSVFLDKALAPSGSETTKVAFIALIEPTTNSRKKTATLDRSELESLDSIFASLWMRT